MKELPGLLVLSQISTNLVTIDFRSKKSQRFGVNQGKLEGE